MGARGDELKRMFLGRARIYAMVHEESTHGIGDRKLQSALDIATRDLFQALCDYVDEVGIVEVRRVAANQLGVKSPL